MTDAETVPKPLIRMKRMYPCSGMENDMLVYIDSVVAHMTTAAGRRTLRFERQATFVDFLIDYFCNVLCFFSLPDTYSDEELPRGAVRHKAGTRAVVPRLSTDPVFMLSANLFGREHQIAFSLRYTPPELQNVRKFLAEFFEKAELLHRSNADLSALFIERLSP